jgi:2-hydroxychromene-2-carboxylate isomerase
MLHIEVFTDPACPFAWSAEPHRRRIQWRYGEQIAWTTRMVVLSEEPRAFTFGASWAALREQHGMPIGALDREQLPASIDACRAFVAARRHAPDRAEALLRALRIRHFAHAEPFDRPEVIAAAARDAGIDAEDLAGWCAEEGTETALRADALAAREPLPAAAALDEKLAGPPGERRYTCPTWVLQRDGHAQLVAPGFQPGAGYDVLVANAAPDLERRADARSAAEVLAAFAEPLAAAEVAAVLGVSREKAEAELSTLGDRDRRWSRAPAPVR